MSTYSFLDTLCALVGPGGSIDLSAGAGIAEEGISIEMTEDKGSMTIGADGEVMHSLHAGKSGTVTVRVLKTSRANALLMDLYNFQTSSAAYYGQNTITLRNATRGDNYTCQLCGFRRAPNNTFAKEGGLIEWAFNAGKIDPIIGTGTPEAA